MNLEEQYHAELISIIIPVYNAEAYLERCIESIRNQTWQNWELILVDDGSTDHSLERSCQQAQKDPRIRVMHTENAGVSMARNRGLLEAQGAYIAFVDADDWLQEECLDILHKNIQQEDDVIGCQFQICTEYMKWTDTGCCEQVCVSGEDWIKEIFHGNTRCWSKLYRREYLAGVRFRKGLTIGEDMLFLLELANRGGRMRNLVYKGYGYFQNPDGAMNGTIRKTYMDQINCWLCAYESVQDQSDAIRKMAGREVLVAVIQILDKLALLSAGQRRLRVEDVKKCRQICRDFRQYQSQLCRNHRLKIQLFTYVPELFWIVDQLYGKGNRE